MMTPLDTQMFAQISTVVVVSVGALAVIGVAVHAYIERAKRVAAGRPRTDEDRLCRLEHAIDVIAVEVERIAEGQRFLTKLQTEAPGDRAVNDGTR